MLTERQRQQRQHGIGSSDAAAIFGLSPYETGTDVALVKRGLVHPRATPALDRFGTEDASFIGQHTEAAIAELAGKCLGVRLVKPKSTYVHASGVLFANVDRQVERAARGSPPVECKDMGVDEGWGEPGTSEVPEFVRIQVCHQMICCGASEGYVARLGRGFRRGLYLYHITAEDEGTRELMTAMEEALPIWWDLHVVRGLPVDEPDRPASFDVVRRVIREPEGTVTLPDDLVLQWQREEEDRRIANEKADLTKRRVLTHLGTAEYGRCSQGRVTFLTNRAGHRQLRFRRAH